MPASSACSVRSSSRSCRFGLVLRHDAVLDVRAVEVGHEVAGVLEAQPGRDLGVGGRGRGGGQRDARHRRPALAQRGQQQVVGPEVVPPLGHAVCLVDREQRDLAPVEQLDRSTRRAAVPARGKAGRARRRRRRTRPRRRSSKSCVELRNPARTPSARNASTWSCISAMSGDTTTPVPGRTRAGDLIAQRLAAARRHQHERVAAADDVLDDLVLAVAERLVAEDTTQHFGGVADRIDQREGHLTTLGASRNPGVRASRRRGLGSGARPVRLCTNAADTPTAGRQTAR